VRWTRGTLIVAALLYIALWGLAIGGATDLVEPLLVPPILAALVVMGVALQRFMGITPRKTHFPDREDDPKP
jgi:hypothetical protein